MQQNQKQQSYKYIEFCEQSGLEVSKINTSGKTWYIKEHYLKIKSVNNDHFVNMGQVFGKPQQML